MTLGDRVAVLRKGVLQQVATPRELYEQPVNLFVAGLHRLAADELPARPRQRRPARAAVRLRARCPRSGAGRSGPTRCSSPGSGRAASRTPRWSTPTRPRGVRRSTVDIDVTEWLGNEQYAYVPFEAPGTSPRSWPSWPTSSTASSCAPRSVWSSTRRAGCGRATGPRSGWTPRGSTCSTRGAARTSPAPAVFGTTGRAAG